MIRNVVLVTRSYYYPLGNTPAVCLTQDLPPEQDADILLLGCGDVRNVLFTCFADATRKIDVTCCDIEPGIHARNILLYSLLIEDKENLKIESTWNIYYHWKLDKNSVELLETQTQKLLEVSKSINEWHASVYGSIIRFCDERSLSLVRAYWKGFQSQGLSPALKKRRQSQLQAALDRAKTIREKMVGKHFGNVSDLRATSPILGSEATTDLSEVLKQWWDCGVTPSSQSVRKATELNPTFLYAPNETLTLHYGLSPLVGFPLSTFYIPVPKGSVFCPESKGGSSPERLVNCAKSHFKLWGSAFRRTVENGSVIRTFCGDALAFGLTLRHCHLALPVRSTTMNLFCDSWTSSLLKLHYTDYGRDKSPAPLMFDIVDTSNLVDHLGPLNVIGVASTLLKYNATSSLYTEMLLQFDSNLANRLSAFLSVDARSIALLLGLVLPELFTNATDSFDFDSVIDKLTTNTHRMTQARSRLRWRRSQGSQLINVEAESLARLMIQVHDEMFKHEDPVSMLNIVGNRLSAISKQANLNYNRASFALLLNLLRATVVTDWNQCVKCIYQHCFCVDSMSSIKTNCAQDLLLYMHLNGVDNGEFDKPTRTDMKGAILASVLPFRADEDPPDQLCVTVRVSREKLKVFTNRKVDEMGTPALVCNFYGQDPSPWLNIFSAVQVTFGKWHEQKKDGFSYPCIKEDSSQLFGTADMFISVFIPTLMLLQSKQSVPQVMCGLVKNPVNFLNFMKHIGPNLIFATSEITSKDVFVTRFMPGVSGVPEFAAPKAQDVPTSTVTTIKLAQDRSKISTLTQRVSPESPEAKAKLALPSSSVEIAFKSPLLAIARVAKSEEFKFEFPIPVSPSKYKSRFARKSSYIEIETPVFDPIEEESASFMFPTFMTRTPRGEAEPIPWTSTHIDLDTMPPIDLKDMCAVSWLLTSNYSTSYFLEMFSERESEELLSREPNAGGQVGTRTSLKHTLFSIFMGYTGLQGKQAQYFGLSTEDGGNQTLVFPLCLRLDLLNHTFVLDTALIPLTETLLNDTRVVELLGELTLANHMLASINVTEAENRAWKAMMPAFVERCRTAASWKHTPSCEYVQAGEVPLTKGVNEEGVSSICSCGTGKFPPGDFLENRTEKLPDLHYIIHRYATRAALGPIFVVPYVEKYSRKKEIPVLGEKCAKCGRSQRENVQQGLLVCSRCKSVKYCSKECQKADWKKHKPLCVAV